MLATLSFSLAYDGLSLLQNKKRKLHQESDSRDSNSKPTGEHEDPLRNATTLYVGNLYVNTSKFAEEVHSQLLTLRRSFYTTEEQIHELFSK